MIFRVWCSVWLAFDVGFGVFDVVTGQPSWTVAVMFGMAGIQVACLVASEVLD